MRNLLILAVAASLAVGCASRSEDEVGAAPDRGDTTAVAADTAQAVSTDTTMGQVPAVTDTTTISTDTTATGVSPDSAMTEQAAPSADTTSASAYPDTASHQPTDSAPAAD